MKHEIKTEKISNELDILHWKLDEFAASFPTPEKVTRIFPIWAITVDDQLVGWFHAHSQKVVYYNLHPTVLSPKAFYKGAHAMVGPFKAMWGDPLIVTHDGQFPDKMLAKVCLEKFPYAVYKVRD